jgi:hypothetical protein
MKIDIDNIIRNVLLEQTAGLKIPVKIKTTYGSLSQQQVQERIGAVHGFRVKAWARPQNGQTPTEADVWKAISKAIEKHPELSKYLNGNYIFIQSDDQRTSNNVYLYNFLVFPESYFDVFTDITSDVTIGDVTGGSGAGSTYRIKNTNVTKINTFYKNLSNLINVDKTKWERFKKWYDAVKNINKQIKTADMPEFEKLPQYSRYSDTDSETDSVMDTKFEVKNVTNTSDPIDITTLQDNLKKMWENNLNVVMKLPTRTQIKLLEFIKREPNENWDSLMEIVVEITNLGFLNKSGIYKEIDKEVYQKIIQYQTEKLPL